MAQKSNLLLMLLVFLIIATIPETSAYPSVQKAFLTSTRPNPDGDCDEWSNLPKVTSIEVGEWVWLYYLVYDLNVKLPLIFNIYNPENVLVSSESTSFGESRYWCGYRYLSFSSYKPPYCISGEWTLEIVYDKNRMYLLKFNLTYPIEAPTLSSHTRTYDGFVLQWTSERYATHYSIYQDGIYIGETMENTYTVNPIDSKTHSYYLIAHNGYQEKKSNTITASIKNMDRPVLIASSEHEAISLSWDSVEGADSYLIYRDGIYLDSTVQTTYRDTSDILSDLETHSYYIVAQHGTRQSESSNIVENNLNTISAPILNLEVEENSIHLTWANILGAEEYHLYKDGIMVGIFNMNSYIDFPMDYNTHAYYVIAKNSKQTSISEEVSASIPFPPKTSPFDSVNYIPIIMAALIIVGIIAVVIVIKGKKVG